MSKTIILVFRTQITVLFRFIIIEGSKYLSGLLVKYVTDFFYTYSELANQRM
jgi:hypothetical protein